MEIKSANFGRGSGGKPFFRQKKVSPNGGPGGDPLVGGLEGKALQHYFGVAAGNRSLKGMFFGR